MLNQIILANVVVSLISLVGGILILSSKIFTKNIIPYLVAFAAGVMLTTVFFDLLPEALEAAEKTEFTGNIFAPAFVGLLISFFIERFVLWFHHHESTHGIHPTAFLITFGDAIHNFIDGLTISSTYVANPGLGIATTIAIAAHEIPQELADFSIYINSGLKKRDALLINLLTALMAIAGGIAGFYFLNRLKFGLIFMLSFSSGVFIYISGSDLIPGLHKHFSEKKKWIQTLPFIAGMVLMYMLIVYLNE